MSDVGEIARATFPDGHTEDWAAGPGIRLSALAVKAFAETCLVPKPVTVDIIQTATPELPFEPTN